MYMEDVMKITLQMADDQERVVVETTNPANSEAVSVDGKKFFKADEQYSYSDGTEAWYDENKQDYERVA
jgi:hypothetical protein